MKSPLNPKPHRAASRAASVRHLMQSQHLQASLVLGQPLSMRIALVAGLQTALAVLLAMVATRLSPWPELIGFSALGALSALFGRFAPMRQRMRILGMTAGLMVLGVLLPSLAVWGACRPPG